MSESNKLFSTFDKLLLGGIGCGLMGLCVLGAVFLYIWVNPPNQRANPTQLIDQLRETITPLPSDLSTLTLTPTLEPGVIPATLIPSPVPGFIGDTTLNGRIVFTCYIKQIDQICLMNADGSGRKQLTDLEATAFYASISPDGQTIYFSSRRSGGFEIYSINVNGGEMQRLTKNIGSLYAPQLSPNGDWIVFTNNGNGLWLMKPDGSSPHAITSADDIDPTWSADGSMIAFASSRAGARQLFVMNADGSNIRQVTNLPDMGGRSSWSPDGTKLAFYAGPKGDHNIHIINADGTGLVKLTNGGDNLGPSWSPDGNWITFASYRDGNNEIYVIHPDGTGAARLTNSPTSDWQPRWGN
jgi:TolB protein